MSQNASISGTESTTSLDAMPRCRQVSWWSGAVSVAAGCFLLAAWFTGDSVFGVDSYFTMAPTVSLGFMLVGGAVMLRVSKPSNTIVSFVVRAVAVLTGAWGLLRIVQMTAAQDFHSGLENVVVLWLHDLGAEGPRDYLMSPITAFLFVLGGISLFLFTGNPIRQRGAAAFFATAVTVLSFVLVVDFFQGFGVIFKNYNLQIALPTGVLWGLLGVGLITMGGPAQFPLSLCFRRSTTVLLMRSFLPVTVAALLVTNYLYNLEFKRGDASEQISRELVHKFATLWTASSLAIISLVILYLARRIGGMIDRAEAARETALQKMQLAMQQAEEHDRAKGQFLANMSHELRTPLAVVIGLSEELREDLQTGSDENLLPHLTQIQAQGEHLLRLINDILDMSKIEAGKMEVHFAPFDLLPVLHDVANTVRPLISKNANTLRLELADDLGSMTTDKTRLKQCLLNLLSNSAKFTREGVITLKAQRQLRSDGEWINFQVRDTGMGMSDQQLAKLFRPFTQVDTSNTRVHGGTGLGLAISRNLCQMMGGEIFADSVPDMGSTFSIRLPAQAPKDAVELAAAQKSAVELPSSLTTSHRVLVVDDDPVVRDMLKRCLTREGFQVAVCEQGAECLRMAREFKPRAITLDVMMPEMDGWAVLSALKADPDLADIPVIIVSIVDDKNLGYALGASDYMTKPLDRDRLVDVLKKRCRGSLNQLALIAEDDPVARDMLRRTLQRAGWDVAEAQNGREALACVEQHRPNLILLDLMMPEMDGFEVIAELRQHDEWQSIPVVVITAKDLNEVERSYLNGSFLLSGCVKRILQKGNFNRDELLQEVRDLVAGAEKA